MTELPNPWLGKPVGPQKEMLRSIQSSICILKPNSHTRSLARSDFAGLVCGLDSSMGTTTMGASSGATSIGLVNLDEVEVSGIQYAAPRICTLFVLVLTGVAIPHSFVLTIGQCTSWML